MALDVDVPTPPDITNRPVPDEVAPEATGSETDLRREELEGILRDGAWREGFEEWAQYTDLDGEDVRRAGEMGLFRAFDFFRDPAEERLRYATPGVPEEWDDREAGGLPGSIVETELDDLGRTVAETVARDYVDWGEEEPSDPVWSVEAFGRVPIDDEE